MDTDSCSQKKEILLQMLSEMKAEDILNPIFKVKFINIEDSYEHIIHIIKETRYACYPVYNERIDNIIGILYVGDLLSNIQTGFFLQNILQDPIFISEKTKLDELLDEFNKKKSDFAIVVDEHGAVKGIITKNDVFDSLCCKKEHSIDAHQLIVEQDESYFLIDAELPLEDFNKKFNVEFDSKICDTIGGYIIDKFTYVPQAGENLILDDVLISVLKTEGAKLEKLKVILKK